MKADEVSILHTNCYPWLHVLNIVLIHPSAPMTWIQEQLKSVQLLKDAGLPSYSLTWFKLTLEPNIDVVTWWSKPEN